MENIICKKLNFSYPNSESSVLNDVSFSVDEGELCLVIGKSGAGKSTLLKLMKKEIAPVGDISGTVQINGRVGYVAQNTEENIVTDRVRSELSFGLTNMGFGRDEIELSVSEIASYFNLSQKLDAEISTLSGGEKQILNLAGVMIMKPDILVLDEPTCQLDPVSAQRFLTVIKRLHRDFGTTVVISEHLTGELFPYADSILIIDNGQVLAKLAPLQAVEFLRQSNSSVLGFVPAFMRLFDGVDTVAGCRKILKAKGLNSLSSIPDETACDMRIKNISFAYEKNQDVLKRLSLDIYKGRVNVILGANSSGKSTLLKVAGGVLKAHHGKVKSDRRVAMLCQNPFDLFTRDKCADEVTFGKITEFLQIDDIKEQHPYDISGGQAQRLALAKVLEIGADIILLDEPTKALDSELKEKLAKILKELCTIGKTVVIATHDIDFAGEYGDYISFLSNGEIVTTKPRREFFSSLSFYTTCVSKITNGLADGYAGEIDLRDGGVL